MLTVEVVARDHRGEVVDVAALGVERLIELIGAAPPQDDGPPGGGPPGGGPPGGDASAQAALDALVWGAARLALEEVERASRTIAAIRAACVSAMGERSSDGPGGERILDELACSLVVSRRSAAFTRDAAETVRTQAPVWAALARGEIDLTRARIQADAALAVPRWDDEGSERSRWQEERAALLVAALPYAAEHTARRLALFLRRRLATQGIDDGPARRRRAMAERGVWVAHDGEGSAELTARLASADAERLYAVIRSTAMADRDGDPAADGRQPPDAWLAGALVDLVLCAGSGCRPSEGSPDAAVPAGRHRVDTVINVTIPIDSLAGLSEGAGVLNGQAVVPADVARRLAAGDSRWRHILTCSVSGALLDVGTLSYRPPASLDRHVRLRDGTCRFPGCSVPARECDLDHLVPFPTGPTSAENLHALCRRHHGLKHEGGWRVDAGPGHSLRWTSPQGAVATTWPDDTLTHVA